ncbi:MAG TPA: hypothetical protein VLV49_01870 [Terriglobales bacterium]|nr:hypothetical protein [Terriglobales bacterium]
MSIPAAEALGAINEKLRGVLSRWQAEPIDSAAILPPVLTGILSDLQAAGQCLNSGSQAPTPEFEKEVSAYRENVQRLELLLPRVQERMLSEKARLEGIRAHLAAASAWAEGRRKIL